MSRAKRYLAPGAILVITLKLAWRSRKSAGKAEKAEKAVREVLATQIAPEMEIVWLVSANAQEGVDYDRAKLTWLWDVTSVADKLIIDQNQQGVNSRYYHPSAYGPMEQQTRSFTEWYLQAIGDADPA